MFFLFPLVASQPIKASSSGNLTDSNTKIMTFNLRKEGMDSGVNEWLNRRDDVGQLVLSAAPSVLGVQEATYFMLLDLEDRLPGYKWVGTGNQGGTKGEYTAIFYRKDILELVNSDQFWLSHDPDVPGSKLPGVTHSRMATWAHFRYADSRKEFLVYNTHLDHLSQYARDFGAKMIRSHLEETLSITSIPVLLMGDMNTTANNTALETLKSNSKGKSVLRNSIDWAKQNEAWVGATYHSFRGTLAGDPIDHILYTADWQLEHYEILNSPIHEGVRQRYPSDHYPVMITAKF